MTRATDFAISNEKLNREELLGTNIEPSYSGVLSYVRRKYSRDLTHADVAVTVFLMISPAPIDLEPVSVQDL